VKLSNVALTKGGKAAKAGCARRVKFSAELQKRDKAPRAAARKEIRLPAWIEGEKAPGTRQP
jgi:hypothetical protein